MNSMYTIHLKSKDQLAEVTRLAMFMANLQRDTCGCRVLFMFIEQSMDFVTTVPCDAQSKAEMVKHVKALGCTVKQSTMWDRYYVMQAAANPLNRNNHIH